MNRSTLLRRAPIVVGTIAIAVGLTGCGGASDDDAASPDATSATSPSATERAAKATPAIEETTTVATTLPAPTTTEFANPFSDAEIATRLLLTAGEYAPDWQLFEGFKRAALDADLASTVPACEPYIGSVFASDDPPNSIDTRWFHTPPGLFGAMSEVVIVFPSDQAAQTMFDASTDPAFIDGCLADYRTALNPTGDLYCCDPAVPSTPSMLGTPIPTDDKLHADDLAIRSFEEVWEDGPGTLHGTDHLEAATVLVGRTVAVIETLLTDGSGAVINTEEQFHHAIGAYVDRARHALGGVDHVPAG